MTISRAITLPKQQFDPVFNKLSTLLFVFLSYIVFSSKLSFISSNIGS